MDDVCCHYISWRYNPGPKRLYLQFLSVYTYSLFHDFYAPLIAVMGLRYRIYDYTELRHSIQDPNVRQFGGYVQLSSLLPIVVPLVTRLAFRLLLGTKDRRDTYSGVVPATEEARTSSAVSPIQATLRRWSWWWQREVRLAGHVLGTQGLLICGGLCAVWFLFLSMVETGDDYLLLARRFGIAGTALLPTQYLMAAKHWNLVAIAFRTSAMELIVWHQMLGRILYALLACHAVLNMNKYVLMGTAKQALESPTAISGLAAFVMLSVIGVTSIPLVRRISYRVFYITHVLASPTILLLLALHAPAARFYIFEAICLAVTYPALRWWNTSTARATFESIRGTTLVRITAIVPAQLAAHCRQHPGTFVYVSIPGKARQWEQWWELGNAALSVTRNPFTVVAVREDLCELTLIVRQHHGPLSRVAGRLSQHESDGPITVPISIDGPHGMAGCMPDLIAAGFDRVLLFAGGVGATFAWPIFRTLVRSHPDAVIDMFWAVCQLSEAQWATDNVQKGTDLLRDRLHLFATKHSYFTDVYESRTSEDTLDGVELSETEPTRSSSNERDHGLHIVAARPNLRSIIDDAFQEVPSGHIAILVCGPSGFVLSIKDAVDPWIRKGRDVWWHQEHFT